MNTNGWTDDTKCIILHLRDATRSIINHMLSSSWITFQERVMKREHYLKDIDKDTVTFQAHPVLVKSGSNVRFVSFLNFCIGSYG